MSEVVSGVHAIDLGMVYAYLYKERDRLTLVDTGLSSSAARIVDAIAAAGYNVVDLQQIVVTHYHADHIGSLAQLAGRSGAQVLAHTLDAPVIRGERPEETPRLSDLEKPFYDSISKDVPAATPTAVDRELADGDEIDVDGGARVVHVPGHTAGSIAVFDPMRRALFCGDAAARMPDGQLIVGVFNADPDLARASFAKLSQLDFDAAFFGHGAPMDKAASDEFRRLAEKLAR